MSIEAEPKPLQKTSLILEINEFRDGEYNYCRTCGSKTMLVTTGGEWDVDQEPFTSGEFKEDDDSIPDSVFVDAEVSGHWCDTCQKLTSLAIHQ